MLRARPIHAALAVFLSQPAPAPAIASQSQPQSQAGTTRARNPRLYRASVAPTPLHVNQLGYLPALGKRATLHSDATAPLPWRLLDASGASVARGDTQVYGADPASGEHLHVIDFSLFKRPGRRYRLQAGGCESHPFAIDARLYRTLRSDALAFFYHQRSGIELRMPYVGQPRWARPAGHLGDRSVRCAPGSGCDYALDVAGGWYDAGDHGKYVVNAGITVWTLLDSYERSRVTGAITRLAAIGDGSANIPEAGNGVSDLLDEARWEIEFLLSMQVPEGQPLAGMAHHKIHDKTWTALGVAPHEDTQERWLFPPSTAATLNLAAVAAQAARIYRDVDPAFSARCLRAARRAFDAARAHPDRLAPASSIEGGGPYDDRELRDEFYWAAAELLITTGEPGYRMELALLPLEQTVPCTLQQGSDAGQHTALTWQSVAAAGTISLARAPDALADLRARARDTIVRAADGFVQQRAHEGYGLPFSPGPAGYPWGSNAFVLNNALVLGSAFELSGAPEYLDAVVGALDYLLGNNPLDQSYVTGYGARPVENPHHRFFARQKRSDRPPPPPGLISGGPNSALQDPYARSAGLPGCAAQRCFVDHIESWSTNEVTINWNAPLAWVAAFLDDHAELRVASFR